jgi:putative hydrolase of the HAD superfamily
MPIRAVIFDFYGTLAEADANRPSWSEIFAEFGHELSTDATRRFWNEGVDGLEHDEHSQSRDHYVSWQHSRVRTIIEESNVPAGDDDELFARLTAHLGAPDLRAYEESARVLSVLRERGFALAICSNWDWDLHEAIQSAGLAGAVDLVVSSAWVGARKPHARIYAQTLAQLGVDASEACFVGDTWTCDVEGPRTSGMHPVYLRRRHLGTDVTAPDPLDTTVTRADDLERVLDLVDTR